MEFSYKISESEFRQAWRLERRASSRSSLKTAAFWMLILLGLLLLYRMIQPNRDASGLSAQQPVSRSAIIEPALSTSAQSMYLERVGPLLVLAGIWILIVGGLVPLRLRRLYLKDPRLQGQFMVNITSDSISTENTAGTTSNCAWNVYDYWCEGKNVIVLMFHSGPYSILSLAGLSEPQRGELRGILGQALRKK